MRFESVCLVLTSCLVAQSYSSKILGIFPMPSKSHYILGHSLLQGLAQRGHEVTMISPYALDKPIKNYKEVVMEGVELVKDIDDSKKMLQPNTSTIEKMMFIYEKFPEMYNMMHNNSNVQKFLASGQKFDACIVSFMIAESMFGMCHKVHAPIIGFSIIGLNSMVAYHTNNPAPYSYVPNGFLPLSDEMTFFDRLKNTMAWLFFEGVIKFISLPYQTKLLNKYHPDTNMDELVKSMDLILLNSHVSTDKPKALLPNVIPIGGFHLQVMEEMPKSLKDFLDNSKNGVIYFNLGSNAPSSMLEPNVLDALTKTFAKLPYDVLWKFETDLPNKPKNVRIEKWLPQRPILMHPKIKVFMTHGGLGGTVESIYGGVPMICMPLFGDQPRNCVDSEKNGYAIQFELLAATEEKLTKAINEIINNPTYKEKILLKSDLYRNQEINPMDKATFWIEHVIRHGGAKHLKSRAAEIPTYQYYLLDVLSFIAAILFLVFALSFVTIKLSFKVLCFLIRKLSGKSCVKKDKKSKKVKIN